MRIFLGLILLGSLFLMAANWQDRIVERLRGERRLKHGVPLDEEVRMGDRWSRLVLGRASGAAPLPVPEELIPDPSAPNTGWNEGGVTGPSLAVDERHVVAPGEVLGKICQMHYASDLPLAKIVAAVADYNDLASENAIREGQVLLLPELSVLFPGED